MFIEWNVDQKPFRDVLLYFQELYIGAFLKECFFSKGNVTSARKIAEMCDKYEVERSKYVYICFKAKKAEVKKIGFRYFNATSYHKIFVNTALDDTWYGYGTVPTSVFDRIKREIATKKIEKMNKIGVIDGLLNGAISPETFAYLIQTFRLEYDDFKEIIEPLAAMFAKPEKKVTLWVKRGILPRDPDILHNFKDFKEWCRQDVKPTDAKTNGYTAKRGVASSPPD